MLVLVVDVAELKIPTISPVAVEVELTVRADEPSKLPIVLLLKTDVIPEEITIPASVAAVVVPPTTPLTFTPDITLSLILQGEIMPIEVIEIPAKRELATPTRLVVPVPDALAKPMMFPLM